MSLSHTAPYPMSMVQTMVNYLYTGSMEKYQGNEPGLFKQLVGEHGLTPHYKVTSAKETSAKTAKVPDVGHSEHTIEIKQETDTAYTPTYHSVPDEIDNSDSEKNDGLDDDRQNVSLSAYTPGHGHFGNDSINKSNKEIPFPSNIKSELNISEINYTNSAAEQTFGKRPNSGVIGDSEAKKIKGEIESENESEKHSSNDEDEKEGEDNWMLDMEKEFVKYRERHKCEICKDGFSNSKEEIDHFYEVWMEKKDKQTPEYPCAICGRVFNSYPDMITHFKGHRKSKVAATCSVCNKSFSRAYDLKIHMRSHVTGT